MLESLASVYFHGLEKLVRTRQLNESDLEVDCRSQNL